LLVENAMSNLSGQGADNSEFMFQKAKYFALAKEYDRAITQLEHAIDRGYRDYELFATITPMFEPLRDEPRFIAVRDTMIAKVNVEREALGLEPIEPVTEPWF
jgi:hypothetical protein